MENKKVLIFGGTSCITPEIIKKLEEKDYTIDLMTFRQEKKVYGEYNWSYLNLEDMSSIKNVLNEIKEKKFSKIIFLPGNSIGINGIDIPYEKLQNFYDAFLLRYVYLIQESSKLLTDDGQIISISSVAANYPVDDANYSAAKAGVQAFVRSLSCNLKLDQSAFSISPGLIYESTSFYQQDYRGDATKLASKDQIAEIIASADKSYNGKVIHLGYQPIL
jgi:NAD(P)-dependent dehydrogenase (short-subunit alcohol dehydrogenase family)